jgi:SAM-dependent methyltransferase
LATFRQNDSAKTMGSLKVSKSATIEFGCHACGGEVPELKARALKSIVGSDCTPAVGNVRIGVCQACGLLQKDISPAWSELCAKIYGSYRIYHQGAGQEQKARGTDGGQLKPRSELIADFLYNTRKLPSAGSALDIGSGNGPFLRAMQNRFSGWSLTGADVTDRFRKQIETIGPNVSFQLTKELLASTDSFDVVSLVHCIEHIPAPADYLGRVKPHIARDGVLLIQVPDAELNPFDLVVADHSSHFFKGTLRAEVEAAGYEVLACGNLVVDKEITLLAQPVHNQLVAHFRTARLGATDIARRNLAWLDATLECGERLAATTRPLGVFGTGIAGIWIGNVIGNKLDFYSDEDVVRVGRDYFGVPIIAPSAIPAGATVFVCLEPKLAKAIATRHSLPDRHFVVPPPVAMTA